MHSCLIFVAVLQFCCILFFVLPLKCLLYVITTGVTGKYFYDYKEMETSVVSRDKEKAKKLWDISADLVKYEAAKSL